MQMANKLNVRRIEEIKWLLNHEVTNFDDYAHIGIRFEDRKHSVGDTCANSKGNPDRFDERSFPEYGTAEYEELEELNGACAYSIRNFMPSESATYFTDHAYIVAGNNAEYGEDDGEIIIEDAVVLEVLF